MAVCGVFPVLPLGAIQSSVYNVAAVGAIVWDVPQSSYQTEMLREPFGSQEYALKLDPA